MLEWKFVVTIESLVRRLSAPVIVFLLTLASTVATVHAAENPRKMTVVSFGLFGDEGVFQREATGAAQIVANRFGGDPVVVKYNTKTGGSATVEMLATTLQAEAKRMNGESDILFLILTSHGSRDGLAVVAGRLAEILKPSHLSEMLGRTGVRNKVVIIRNPNHGRSKVRKQPSLRLMRSVTKSFRSGGGNDRLRNSAAIRAGGPIGEYRRDSANRP